jgi:hypothetical protein
MIEFKKGMKPRQMNAWMKDLRMIELNEDREIPRKSWLKM